VSANSKLYASGTGRDSAYGDYDFLNPVIGMPEGNIKAVSSLYSHVLILMENKKLYGLANNVKDALGVPGKFYYYYPIFTGHTDVEKILAGRLHSVILKNDSLAYFSGSNSVNYF
jgi:alpha-tubulin suppressor-like RCC1 family protein